MRFKKKSELANINIEDFIDVSNGEYNLGEFSIITDNNILLCSLEEGNGNYSILKIIQQAENDWNIIGKYTIENKITSIDVWREYIAIGQAENNLVEIYFINEDSSDNFLENIWSDTNTDYDNFGINVCIDENILLVSLRERGEEGNVSSYLFSDNFATVVDTYYLEKTLNGRDFSVINDMFGNSLSIYEKNLVVGARGKDNGRGCFYYYSREDNNSLWELKQVINSFSSTRNNHFGDSVFLYKNSLFVAATGINKGDYLSVGKIYVFNFIDNKWEKRFEIEPSISVSINDISYGKKLYINNNYAFVSGTNFIDVFKYNNGSWQLIQTLKEEENSNFGIFTCFNNNGFLVVGDDSYNFENTNILGNVYIYKLYALYLKSFQKIPYIDDISKISLKLINISKNNKEKYFNIMQQENVSIDASNCLENINGDFYLEKEYNGVTGCGAMRSKNEEGIFLSYPIKSESPCLLYIGMRVVYQGDNINILIDDSIGKTDIIDEVEYSKSNNFQWVYSQISIPDNEIHTFSINLKGQDILIDKIVLSQKYQELKFEGPSYSSSNYLTVFTHLYLGNDIPSVELNKNACKETKSSILKTGDYLFNIL